MTAEVAVMNKQAIALAADSAVTFRDDKGQKIFTSASKIFTLSKYHPVGVMVYGSANIMGVPWETVIKIYRSQLEQEAFDNISDYAEHFISFLTDEEFLSSEPEEEHYVKTAVYSYFYHIVNEIDRKLKQAIETEGEQKEERVKEIFSQVIQSHFDRWKSADLLPQVPADWAANLKRKHGKSIQEAKKHFFKDVSNIASRQLTEIALDLFVKYPEGMISSNTSGVVIAGFGTNDMFPALVSFSIDGEACGFMKYKKNEEESTEIDFENNATIVPFAQGDMVATFMTGVDPSYQADLERELRELFTSYPQVLVGSIDTLSNQEKYDQKSKLQDISNDLLTEFRNRLHKKQIASYVNPIMRIVHMLPKDELAAMAESLISLTSFKRRVSMDEETVGGPIDVAVISKGDGFIWIKRKHYFDRELNQQFFANYYREIENDGSQESTNTKYATS